VQLYERLRLTGAASVGGLELRAKRVKGGQAFDIAITRRGPAGEVDLWAYAEEMELRSDRSNKRLLMRLKDGRVWYGDGSRALWWGDRVWEVELP
jgi:hypothetical protein